MNITPRRLEQKHRELLAELRLGFGQEKRDLLVEYALALAGDSPPSPRTLAEIIDLPTDHPSTKDMEELFIKLIEELSIELPAAEGDAIFLALSIADQVVNGHMDPELAAKRLYSVSTSAGLPTELIEFYTLEDTLRAFDYSEERRKEEIIFSCKTFIEEMETARLAGGSK